ncbi:adenosylcobinamide-GDP ribazoletransferase [Clostridiaceae bacterium M8S5]|nr:adenosylcobinamide-GDP ribazoletransferase [Clostridiaceae bacterium M8S5]
MKGFLLMLTFLTRIPINIKFEFKEKDFLSAVYIMPIIGLIIGGLMYTVTLPSQYFHKPIISIVVWIIYIYITGGLHIDGLADSVDGILSNRSKERVLEIMKDSRIGAFGVLAIFMLFTFNIALTCYIDPRYILLTPVVGRCSGVVAASIGRYARKDGMGKAIIESSGKKEAILAILISGIISFIVSGLVSLTFLIGAIFTAVLIVKYFTKKIDGITGDTIGFTIEFTQCIYLFITYIYLCLR